MASKTAPMFHYFEKMDFLSHRGASKKSEKKSGNKVWYHSLHSLHDSDQNWLSNKINKMVPHWGSFGSIYYLINCTSFSPQYLTQMECGNSKQCHVTLFTSVWHVQLRHWCFLTFYHHYETHFCYSALFGHFSPQWGVFSVPNSIQNWSREGYCGQD